MGAESSRGGTAVAAVVFASGCCIDSSPGDGPAVAAAAFGDGRSVVAAAQCKLHDQHRWIKQWFTLDQYPATFHFPPMVVFLTGFL
jgi:hypothetical protein